MNKPKTKNILSPKEEYRVAALPEKLPLLPIRDIVVFPHMVVPVLVVKESSVKAVQEAMVRERLVFLSLQKDPNEENPAKEQLFKIGVVARTLRAMRLPNDMMKVLLEGGPRARILRFIPNSEFMEVKINLIPRIALPSADLEARARMAVTHFTDYVKLHRQIPDEVLMSISGLDDPSKLADVISAQILQKPDVKQMLLEAGNTAEQLDLLVDILASEKEILEIEHKLDNQVRDRIQKSQKEFYLHEQIKVIREELGESDDGADEIAGFKEKIRKAKMPKEAAKKAFEEVAKLEKMHVMSPESTVVRNYLDWLVSMPWSKRTKDNLDTREAQRILDEDHYGLEKPKERIVEHLAVVNLAGKIKGPILCFVGAPGTGKTSLGKSIARALRRRFVRMSLGGVRDEAEIRGHRRTYIGSMPGRIIQAIRRAGTKNPVFLLDEVDKMSVDFRGDPSAALLEVLDPEQNSTFNDHYLDVDFDLSEVLFITTANSVYPIPPALRDRMEIITLPGYLEHEKLEIAKRHLVPKQYVEHGMKDNELKITDGAILKIIRNYTREAGVRNLQREIANICRKAARKIVEKDRTFTIAVDGRNIEKYIGIPKIYDKMALEKDQVGIATGLAYTENGGDILTIEVNLLKGKGKLILTGKLGEVMKESAQAALSYSRAIASQLNIDDEIYNKIDVHIHVPEGAVPKDGPSAGIAIATALTSALTNRPVHRDVAMTGEITLRGNVLPVGGLNEKIFAAQRAGIHTVILPEKNRNNLSEIPDRIKKGLDFVFVNQMDKVLEVALAQPTEPSKS